VNPPLPIRVIIVDDHVVVRTGLRLFLSAFDDMQLAGEGGNGREAVDLCARVQPDVVLMDLIMPEMDGVTATRTIRERFPHVQVIALTSFTDQDLVQEALQAGAIGYLLKDVSAGELAAAIRAAQAGRPTLAPEAAQALIRRPDEIRLGQDLTPREREVLALMTNGLSNADIAKQLVVSLSTVKYHVSAILTKLGASSRADAISLAFQHHLVKPDRPRSPG